MGSPCTHPLIFSRSHRVGLAVCGRGGRLPVSPPHFRRPLDRRQAARTSVQLNQRCTRRLTTRLILLRASGDKASSLEASAAQPMGATRRYRPISARRLHRDQSPPQLGLSRPSPRSTCQLSERYHPPSIAETPASLLPAPLLARF